VAGIVVRALELASIVVVEAGRSMGRPPCCDKANVKKGPWTPEEDAKLLAYTSTHGTGNWTNVPQRAGDRAVHQARRGPVTCVMISLRACHFVLGFWLMVTRRWMDAGCGMM